MKKIILVVAMLMLAAPAMATVTITAVDEGSGVVAIKYSSDSGLVRAFGLDITADSSTYAPPAGALITTISDYNVGECNSVTQGYGIFMSNIQIDENGKVTDYSHPVADPCGPGSPLGGLNTPGITIEMGSLYEDANTPPASGTLCKVTVDRDCQLSVAANTACGGVAMENATAASLNLSAFPINVDDVTGFDAGHSAYAEFVEWGMPDCWLYKYHCWGDADGKGVPKGLFNDAYRVSASDMTVLLQGWKKADGSGTNPQDPAFDICGDVTRTGVAQGLFNVAHRVGSADMTVLLQNWKDNTNLTATCGGTTYHPDDPLDGELE